MPNNVGLYVRLSRDDYIGKNERESMSITNQREQLLAYAAEKGWEVTDIYADDGYSGTTFERPDFQRMIRDIENGKLDTIITKDLSRLGRNYVETGQYTDFIFPQYGVRYIAVNDNYDSENEDNDIAPFKNILNEMYAKDISRKVKSAKAINAKQGKFMGSKPPYGYMRSSDDKHLLVPDPETSKIVELIFSLFSNGNSGRYIADILNSQGILSPAAYYYSKQERKQPNSRISNSWGSATVLQILKNQVYIGHMVQGKRKVVSFKTKQRKLTSPDSWIVVKHTHTPIISKNVWNKVYSRISGHTKHKKGSKNKSLFSGLLRCADCNSSMTFHAKRQRDKLYETYRCGRYVNHGKNICSIHSISLSFLTRTVIKNIRDNAQMIEMFHDSCIKQLTMQRHQQLKNQHTNLKSQIDNAENRMQTITKLSQHLFEEKQNGNVPESTFKKLICEYDNEQAQLQTNIASWNKELFEYNDVEKNITIWADTIVQYTHLKKLNRKILSELIESITIFEKDNPRAETQMIEINYKHVGDIGKYHIAFAV